MMPNGVEAHHTVEKIMSASREEFARSLVVLLDVADRYELPVLAPPIPRTVRFAEASASGSSVLAGRKSKGGLAYRELAQALLKHWKSGKKLPTFTPEVV